MLEGRNSGKRGARGPALRVSRCETKIKTKINEIEKKNMEGGGELRKEGAGSQNRRGRGPREVDDAQGNKYRAIRSLMPPLLGLVTNGGSNY